jgi:CRISPR-associated protein Cas8a1/Csx13
MTLKAFNQSEFEKWGGWILNANKIEIYWKETPRDILSPIIKNAFGISKQGVIQFAAYKNHPLSDLERLLFHRAIFSTYLQHGKTRKLDKKEQLLSIEFEGKTFRESIKPVLEYSNQNADKLLFDKMGMLKKDINLSGWLFPGGVVRHVLHNKDTTLTSNSEKILALIFAPVASLFFLLSHRNNDGKFDKRKVAALVLPHIQNLESFHRCYRRYLTSPVQKLFVNGLSDAGLTALTLLNLISPDGIIGNLEIDSCSVVTMGTAVWAKQQKTRTGIRGINDIDPKKLNFFEVALRVFPTSFRFNDNGKLIFFTSGVRGLIAENIAIGKDWFFDFKRLMSSKSLSRLISFERKEVAKMVEKKEAWAYEEDQLLVEAIHQALRNRYGALANRARQKGEVAQFGREFERLRTSLMRAKNAQNFRAEIADLFARSGLNQTMQKHWKQLLPNILGPDWQRSRDLALLSLASYTGKGEDVLDLEVKNELIEEE